MHPLDAPIRDTAARVRDPNDDLTATQLVEESLRRIEEHNDALNAFLFTTKERAFAQAAHVDTQVAKGEDPGSLAGIPIGVKDNITVAGERLTCGSKILGDYVAPRDATCVSRVERAGACIVGKTNLDEFAMGSSTEHSAFGASRNPYDPACVPGGSSGGSAAAVAAGLVPLAFGSDTGGSIRQPAALCGIVGLKPTYGRVSRNGLVAFGSSLDQIGPMTRYVDDARALQQVIQGPDTYDRTTHTFDDAPVADIDTLLSSLRIGRVSEFEDQDNHESMGARRAAAAARDLLIERGASTKNVSLPLLLSGIPIYYVVAPAEASSNLARFDGVRYGARSESNTLEELYARSRSDGFGTEVKRRILLGTFALSAGYADAYYKRAMAVRAAMAESFRNVFKDVDVLITPTTPGPAFRVGEKADDPIAMYLCDLYTVAANLVGTPVISIPAGRSKDGLPLGVQLWGKKGSENTLLALASYLEATSPACAYVAPTLGGTA